MTLPVGVWTTPTYSNSFSNCVEVQWAKSSYSFNEGNCTEVRRDGDAILVRDSKEHGAGPVLEFTPGEWETFLAGVRAGDFELPAA